MKKQSDLSRLMGYAGHHKYLTYASWVLSAVSALIALVPFLYIWGMINEVIKVAPHFEQAEHLPHYGIMAVIFGIASLLVYIGGLMCSHLSAFRVATNMRIDMMHHIVKLPLGVAEDMGSGKLRRIVNDASAATETYLAHQLPDQAAAMVTPIGLIIMLVFFDWRLGLLSLVPIALGFLVMMQMTGAGLQQKMTEYQNALNDMSNEAVEYVRGIPVVKTFGQTVFSFKRFKGTIDKYSEWASAYTKALRVPMMLYTTAINAVFVVLIAAGIVFTRNEVTPEFLLNLIFYIIITPIIALNLGKIMHQSENKMIVTDALQRVDEVMDLKPFTQTKHAMLPVEASVKLKDVSYSYDGKKNAVDHISLDIRSGQTVAFVGPSGGGKSTVASIIARFFDPQQGQVFIGGVDIKSIPKKKLMNYISFVFQNNHLIKGSILENVKLGKPDATKEEVMRALRAAQCIDIIEKMPNGVDTILGTNGVYLSGGEKQRLAIARAMLKDAPILILDEATAFADPDNENKVQAALSVLAKGKTVIMIAHRLSTVKQADKIFVLSNGKVYEEGTFAELTHKEGLFAAMWQKYQTSVEWKVGEVMEA